MLDIAARDIHWDFMCLQEAGRNTQEAVAFATRERHRMLVGTLAPGSLLCPLASRCTAGRPKRRAAVRIINVCHNCGYVFDKAPARGSERSRIYPHLRQTYGHQR